MWPTGPTWWHYVIRVVFLGLLFFVSACTAPGCSLSTPLAYPHEGGLAGSLTSGNGDGGM